MKKRKETNNQTEEKPQNLKKTCDTDINNKNTNYRYEKETEEK